MSIPWVKCFKINILNVGSNISETPGYLVVVPDDDTGQSGRRYPRHANSGWLASPAPPTGPIRRLPRSRARILMCES